MGVDVVHRLRGNPGVGQGLGHTGGPARPAGGGGGDVVGVAGGAIAQHLPQDLRPPGPGAGQFLQHQDARPLPHNKAAPLPVKGDGGPAGVR